MIYATINMFPVSNILFDQLCPLYDNYMHVYIHDIKLIATSSELSDFTWARK